ncbi:MAG: helix-turn-helix domain-containing protein [Lachnospiraceae bacterium]|nr:helix-turn-helix domain-containing protein [Lachnospiraceae bacterium]
MISSQILQSTIDGINSIAGVNLAVYDGEGVKLATSNKNFGDKELIAVKEFIESTADSRLVQGTYFNKIYDEGQLEYVLIASGQDETTEVLGKMAAFQLEKLLVAYKERFDRDNFIKNLLLDNLLLIDIFNRSKKLHIEVGAKRCVFIIEINDGKKGNEVDSVRTLFSERTTDFVTAVDEKNVIYVRQTEPTDTSEDMNKIAVHISDALSASRGTRVRVSYGTIVNELKEVSRSYKEAKAALDVGEIFFEEKDVVGYSSLGIGRLIYQLPIPLCKMFIKEIFRGKSPDDFDEETVLTINKFFENSLNVSETSRQLYIHRNTLVYRLDKLEKSTGLDIRVFEDAITLKIALMVVKYMKHMETIDY